MNICLLGNGLTNLFLAKILVQKKIKVHLFYNKKILSQKSTRTIGISKENVNFLEENNLKIKKISWPIHSIRIFNELNNKQEILNFGNENNQKFSVFKNYKLYKILQTSLQKEKNFSFKVIKNNSFYNSIIKNKKYDLIINTDPTNFISKNFFYNKIKKNYNSLAYTTIIKHKKIKNNCAYQIFTKIGPIAFLPISKYETSVVYSIFMNKKYFADEFIKKLIIKYNKIYKIISFSKIEKFNLKLSLQRKYYHNNILNFGDNLHKIHPLAGQGFNMNLRDIKILSKLIDKKIKLGLVLDVSLLEEFEKNAKHLNFIFSFGIDFIYEFFRFDSKFEKNYSKMLFKFLNNNKFFNKYSSKFADKGLVI